MEKYYKILDPNGKPRNGGSGTYSLPTKNDDGTWTPGEWMPFIENIELCESGYHVCERGDVLSWAGPEMYVAEVRGETIRGDTKTVCQQVRLLRKVEAWNDRTLRLFAVWCAREALKLIDDPDPRSIAACDVAERFANCDATYEELIDARDAAWTAAMDAARAAAWAARDAAWTAAMDAARYAAWAAARDAHSAAARTAAWHAAWVATWIINDWCQ